MHYSLCLSKHVLAFLDFRDLQICRGVCWDWNAVCGSRDTEKRCIRAYGLPRMYRFKFWLTHSQSLAISKVGGSIGTYRASLQKSKFMTLNKEASWFTLTQQPGLEGEIARDVCRTFPDRILFRVKNGLGQRMLFNILVALAVYEPKVGYCQGMNFVVAVMIAVSLGFENKSEDTNQLAVTTNGLPKNVEEELESRIFWLMVAFLNRFDMRELWRPGVPQLKLRIYQFDRLISSKLPSMHAHFRSIGLAPDFFASQWFLTLMSYNVSMAQLVRVWDVLIFDGWKTIFRIGIAVLSNCEQEILQMSLEQLSHFFRHGGKKTNKSSNNVNKWFLSDQSTIEESFKVKISTRELSDLESDYITHILFKRVSEERDIVFNNGDVEKKREKKEELEKQLLHQQQLLAKKKNNKQSTKDDANDDDDDDDDDGDVFVDHRLAAIFREEIDHLDNDTKNDVHYLRGKIEQAQKLYKEKEITFKAAAQEYIEIKTTLDELKASKVSVSNQLYELTKGQGSEGDYMSFFDKVEFIDSRIRAVSEQFRDALWKTSQAEVDLEEVVEQKNAFSQQLQAVLEHNEHAKSFAIKQIWNQLQ